MGLSFVSERKKHVNLLKCEFCFYIEVILIKNSLPGRMNVMRPEVMAMDPKMRVGMIGLISARAATVVDNVPPT